MILYPDIQSRIQQEIDNVVGRDREVTYADKVNMPFTDATIMEVRRIATPFPVTPPRVSTKCVHKNKDNFLFFCTQKSQKTKII